MNKKQRIILVRHGETWSNREGRILGSSDSPLTPEGIELAEKLACIIVDYGMEAVFSSSLGRALSSAEIYTGKTGCPIFPRSGMRELGCGLWEGRIRAEVAPDKNMIRTAWNDRPPGGESYSDGESRVGLFVSELKSFVDCDSVLVVGHASVNRVFLKLWLGLTPEFAARIHTHHDMIYILQDNEVSGVSISLGRLDGLLV